MADEDCLKTSFVVESGIYCHKVMPFGLKNTVAMYQRLVNRMFKGQIEKIMEVYVDDILVKSVDEKDHVAHLEEAFEVMRRYGLKLNPEK